MLSNKNFNRLIRIFPNFLWPLKVIILKNSIKSKGKNFKMGSNVILYNYREIEVGDNVFIGDGTTIGGNVPVRIGNNVMFGPEVMIRGGDHNMEVIGIPMAKVKHGGTNLPIVIEDDVWIGTRVIILKGVTISEGAVIGAGSIVTRDVLPYTINIGSPSGPIRCRFSEKGLEDHLYKVNSGYSFENIKDLYEKNSVLFNKKR
jgi:acetyltransferase-like isoleucine patch superfamily enzyme